MKPTAELGRNIVAAVSVTLSLPHIRLDYTTNLQSKEVATAGEALRETYFSQIYPDHHPLPPLKLNFGEILLRPNYDSLPYLGRGSEDFMTRGGVCVCVWL